MSDYFLIAAEISGDHLGGSLMQALKRKDPEARFFGVGGPAMKAEGLDSLFPISDLAVMGFSNVIRNLSRIRARIRETAEAIVRNPPDAIVMIDSYGFSAQVGKRVRKLLPRAWRSAEHVCRPSVDGAPARIAALGSGTGAA